MRPSPGPNDATGIARDTQPAAAGRLPSPRRGYEGAIPAWPAQLIDPTDREIRRWEELWRGAEAFDWFQRHQTVRVATFVRLEERCAQRRLPKHYLAQFEGMREELGLSVDSADDAPMATAAGGVGAHEDPPI
jgi:hypothetical protein